MSKALAPEVNARSETHDPVEELWRSLVSYLPPEQVEEVRRAYVVGADAHQGQLRRSGEPYIHHPVEVARILAGMRMDSQTLAAAILHDTIEDTELDKSEVSAQFGESIAELVDGVTKLDRMNFGSRQEADAESFRKMMLAMSRDIRVILIKLADRLHNMRTLAAMAPDKRRRIARETLEIYAPIAQRLGMNALKSELQDWGFANLYPRRYEVIARRLEKIRGSRQEPKEHIAESIRMRLAEEGIEARVVGRIKAPYSIYRKMRSRSSSFQAVTDVLGFRIVVDAVGECYRALGAVHNLYKPVAGKFTDYIAIPKANGYQSLHTVLFGPASEPVEIQIRTEDMDLMAEKGIAAHWMYKDGAQEPSGAQSRARDWLLDLLELQKQAGSSVEFLEHVKIDLFPDEIFVFSPSGDIFQLPRDATALDFAYAVHTDIGDHCVYARIDKRLQPKRTKLASGQTVEIITAPSAHPTPDWLDYVVTGKARSAIRHYLKNLRHEAAVEFGHRMLDRALDSIGASLEAVPEDRLDALLADCRLERLEELLSDIALGNRMPLMVAKRLVPQPEGEAPARTADALTIKGTEGRVVTYANCCHPIPGDAIVGYLSAGKGIVVHTTSCHNLAELGKSPERCMEVAWDPQIEGTFRAAIRADVANKPGVLATVAAEVAATDSNIEHVEYQQRDVAIASLLFTITVRNRKHLARILRRVRRNSVVVSVHRASH